MTSYAAALEAEVASWATPSTHPRHTTWTARGPLGDYVEVHLSANADRTAVLEGQGWSLEFAGVPEYVLLQAFRAAAQEIGVDL